MPAAAARITDFKGCLLSGFCLFVVITNLLLFTGMFSVSVYYVCQLFVSKLLKIGSLLLSGKRICLLCCEQAFLDVLLLMLSI